MVTGEGGGETPGAGGDSHDEALRTVVRDSTRILAYTAFTMALFLLVGGLAIVMVSVHYYDALRATDKSTCDFWEDIGTLVPALSPPPPPSVVHLIADARTVYNRHGCGALPPPPQQLLQLERKYGIRQSA
jgi:hypothetical protein